MLRAGRRASALQAWGVCEWLCAGSIAALVAVFTLVAIMQPAEHRIAEWKTFGSVVGEAAHKEWLGVLHNGTIAHVNFFHKGLAKKYQVMFESGHVAAAKPIEPDYLLSPSEYRTVDYNSLSSKEKYTVRRSEWEYQGFSEIVAYHLDRILEFYRKPPIVGKVIDNKILYETDDSWGATFRRNLGRYSAKMALVPWMEDLKRSIPSLDVRDALTIKDNTPLPEDKVDRKYCGDVSDKLVFDFIIDDHDTQGIQNWKADIASQLLHWDSGLGWRDGPFSHRRCLDILCGTKEWKGVSHYDPNPPTCDRICRFRKSTVKRVKKWWDAGDGHPSKSIGEALKRSLAADPLNPLFHLGIFRYRTSSGREQDVHLEPEIFFDGLQKRLRMLLDHVEECILEHSPEEVLVDM